VGECGAGSVLARAISGRHRPGVHGCCYTVAPRFVPSRIPVEYGSKLFREVEESDPVRESILSVLTARAPGHSEVPKKIFLDLVKRTAASCSPPGVTAKTSGHRRLCTSCRTDMLFSYRAEKGVTGRMMAVAEFAFRPGDRREAD